MLTTVDQIVEVLDIEPEIDPEVFWPRVGVSLEAIHTYAGRIARFTGIPRSAILATLESGAILAEYTLKGGTDDQAS